MAYVLDEGVYRVVASAGGPAELDAYERSHPIQAGRDTLVGRVALTGAPAQIEDIQSDVEYAGGAARGLGYGTLLGLPILQDAEVDRRARPGAPPGARLRRAVAPAGGRVRRSGGHRHRQRAAARDDRSPARPAVAVPVPQVAALVSSRDGEQLLAGHRREITAVFCDLRNFTVFSETAEPEEVLGFLRAYHAAMGRLVVEHEGTLEHFAGDGFMTFFNDPVLQPGHAARAVGMAVAMRERFEELAVDWRKRGHSLEIGIGIATGYATLGRIGFEGRYDYGAIGNAIILASRLSGEAKPGQILIAPRTLAAAEAALATESVGEVKLKGFSRPIEAHAVLGLAAPSDVPASA